MTMAITIKKVSTSRDLKRFIRFNYQLYKGNPYSVPDLYDDMLNTFNKKKNAAFEFCEADYFLAYKDNRIVGRVAAIINHKANQTWNKKDVRFGWIDFIDDPEVSEALIRTVEEWGKERGMTHIQGPLGFTDFDAEGMLIEGYDQLSTMATIYNYPYYPQHMERMGFEKDADWVEFKIYIPDAIPDKHKRISDLIQRKYNLKIKKYTSPKKIAQEYGQAIFELMNEAYKPLFGYSALSQRQIDQYVKMYLPIVDLRMVTLITDADDQLIAVVSPAQDPLPEEVSQGTRPAARCREARIPEQRGKCTALLRPYPCLSATRLRIRRKQPRTGNERQSASPMGVLQNRTAQAQTLLCKGDRKAEII